MRQALTAALMLIAAATAPAADAPMEEIVVTGEHAGPGMWQVTQPGQPGHTLWIVGEPPLLPKGIHFNSKKVTLVASQSQEILEPPGFSVQPDKKIGVFRMLTLAPAAFKLRKNPDKATLREIIHPDVYTRWLAQKKLYLGHDSGVETMRPIVAAEKLSNAAIEQLQVGYGGTWPDVWQLVRTKHIPVTTPTLEFKFKADELRGQMKAAAHENLADAECFSRTVELVEALSNKEVEGRRARAWATGDLTTLKELPPLPDPDPACDQAIVNALATAGVIPINVREQVDEKWFTAAGNALTKNENTLAFVPMSALLGERGYLETLRKRGYEILAPG